MGGGGRGRTTQFLAVCYEKRLQMTPKSGIYQESYYLVEASIHRGGGGGGGDIQAPRVRASVAHIIYIH